MIKLRHEKNTILFYSTKHNLALGYYVTSFRKRRNISESLEKRLIQRHTEKLAKLEVIQNLVKRAESLENSLPVLSNYASILYQAKKHVYSNRIDMLRNVESVIHPIIEENDQVTIKESWDLLMNSKGYSVFTGKPIKPITCQEKRIKVLKRFIELLSENC